MREIETALLTGQKQVIVGGVEIKLPTLKPDTLACKEREARKKANEIMKILNS